MESTVSVEFQERAFKILLSLPGNQLCADCPAACPDWASVNLGVFVCHKCSGVHRAIGLHITRIKSIKLDSWTLKQMFMMNCVNNEEANSYWEAKRPNNRPRPNHETPQEVLKNFIYSKYVYKEFVDPDARPPLEHVIENLNIEAEKVKEENKEQYFQRKVKELEDMLKAKAMVTSVGKVRPFNSSDKNDKKMAKSTSPLRKPTEKTIENMSQSSIATQRVHSHPPNQETTSQEVGSRLLVSASTMPTEKKDSNAKNSNPFERLNLFEGLNVKSISPPQRKEFLKQNSMELQGPSQPRLSSRIISATPKNNPFEVFSFSSMMEKSPPQVSSTQFFQSSRSNINEKKIPEQENMMYEMSDMSKNSSKNDIKEEKNNKHRKNLRSNSLGLNEEGFDKDNKMPYMNKIRLSQTINQERFSGNCSRTSLDIPFFMNMSPGRLAQQGLKRPSDDFEMLQLENYKNKPKKRNLIRPSGGFPRFIVLFGALLLHFAFGYIYCWGSISVYLAFFFKEDYQESYYLDVASYSTLIFLAITLGYTFTENLVNSFGFRKTSFSCFVIIFLMMTLCSWTMTPVLYSIIPTFVIGFFLGLAYHIPYFCAVQYFAHKSTTLKGLFYLFDGVGAFYFACWSYMYLGLDTIQPRLDEDDNDFYPKAIMGNIPGMIQTIGIHLLGLGVLGSLTMKPKFNFVEKDWSALRDKEEGLLRSRTSIVTPRRRAGKALFRDLKHALMSPASRNLFQIVVFSSILGTYYLCSYKVAGLELGYNDTYLTLAGSSGMIVMSLGKIAALIIHRRTQFRKVMKNIFIIQALIGICSVGAYEYFLVYFMPLMFITGFMNALVIEEVIFAFSDELESPMIAVMMIGLTVSNFTAFTLMKVGEYLLSHKLLNIVLILPLIRAYYINRKYSGGEVRETSSVAELEVARILED